MVALATAFVLGLAHTILGPDHYVPFIVIGRARKWGLGRTWLLTSICGLGHVLSSVALGMVGAAAGAALSRLEAWESLRGGLAGWSLLVFGAGYGGYGVWRANRKGAHGHTHLHADGTLHRHGHEHDAIEGHPSVHEHEHPASPGSEEQAPWRQLTPWLLFIIFVLGPCEPLIPLFFAEAARGDWTAAWTVAIVYSAATLFAMLGIVTLFWFGMKRLSFGRLERYEHALAGGIILLAGAGMVFLGL